jgi:hypothetical protein
LEDRSHRKIGAASINIFAIYFFPLRAVASIPRASLATVADQWAARDPAFLVKVAQEFGQNPDGCKPSGFCAQQVAGHGGLRPSVPIHDLCHREPELGSRKEVAWRISQPRKQCCQRVTLSLSFATTQKAAPQRSHRVKASIASTASLELLTIHATPATLSSRSSNRPSLDTGGKYKQSHQNSHSARDSHNASSNRAGGLPQLDTELSICKAR